MKRFGLALILAGVGLIAVSAAPIGDQPAVALRSIGALFVITAALGFRPGAATEKPVEAGPIGTIVSRYAFTADGRRIADHPEPDRIGAHRMVSVQLENGRELHLNAASYVYDVVQAGETGRLRIEGGRLVSFERSADA